MRARLKIGSKFGYGDIRAGTIPPNSTLMMDFSVYTIGEFPTDEEQEL